MNRYFFISNHRVLCFLYSLLCLPLCMFVSYEQFMVCENTDLLSRWQAGVASGGMKTDLTRRRQTPDKERGRHIQLQQYITLFFNKNFFIRTQKIGFAKKLRSFVRKLFRQKFFKMAKIPYKNIVCYAGKIKNFSPENS